MVSRSRFSGTGGRVIDPDRMGEVSRGHIRRERRAARKDAHGRIRNPDCKSKEQEPETLGLNGSDLMLSSPLKARTV
jgi:hypothetical protein